MGQQQWDWTAPQFEKVTEGAVKTDPSKEAWWVNISEPNRAWGYRIPMPAEARAFLLWRSTLRVMGIDGAEPALAFMSSGKGAALQLSGGGAHAELRFADREKGGTFRVARFVAPAPKEDGSFDITLEFNDLTKVITGSINGKRVCVVNLPFKDLPMIEGLTDVEIITTTPPDGTGGGAAYGGLSLECE